MNFPYGETVVVLTPGTIHDPYSDTDVPSWDEGATPPTETPIEDVAVADGGSLETAEVGRERVDSDFDLMFPPDAVVTAQNRVIVRGLTCDVAGRPFLWANPFTGWTPGLVVHAKIREG